MLNYSKSTLMVLPVSYFQARKEQELDPTEWEAGSAISF